jgi:membrane-associated phospholipid phosphatase
MFPNLADSPAGERLAPPSVAEACGGREAALRDIAGLGGFALYVAATGMAAAAGAMPLARQLALGLAATYVVLYALRLVWIRPRPEPRRYPQGNLWARINATSFPSMHAMRGAVLWTILARHAGGAAAALVSISVIAVIAATRVLLREHHATDALAGAVVGIALGWVIP